MAMPTAIPTESLFAVAIVSSILCIAVVSLRFLARYASKTQIMWDDWLIIPALSVSLGMVAVVIASVRMGGYSNPAVPPTGLDMPASPDPGLGFALDISTPSAASEMIKERMKQSATVTRLEAIFQCLQILSLTFLKASVLFFYRRLFVTGLRSIFDWVTRFLLGLMIVWGITFLITGITACPARLVAGTTVEVSDPRVYMCTGAPGMSLRGVFAFIVTDVITDVAVLLVPLPMIWRLQMQTKRKLATSGVFLLGGLAVLSSVLRLAAFVSGVSLRQTVPAAGPPQAGPPAGGPPGPATSTPSGGHMGFASLMFFYSMLETGLAMIAACLPCLRVLCTKKGWLSLRSRSKLVSACWSRLSGASALAWRGHSRGRDAADKDLESWSGSERSTAVRTPSPAATRSGVAERESPKFLARLSAPLSAGFDAEAPTLDEEDTTRSPAERGEKPAEGDTEWLRPTLDASREAQV